jgi:hypothetical protein
MKLLKYTKYTKDTQEISQGTNNYAVKPATLFIILWWLSLPYGIFHIENVPKKKKKKIFGRMYICFVFPMYF